MSKGKSHTEVFYPESRFGGFTDIDGTIAFYNRVNALLKSTDIVLDIGCGRGEYGDDPLAFRRNLRILKKKVRKVIGVDVDKVAVKNPFLDQFFLMTDKKWPIKDRSIDLVLGDWVLEHVQNPDNFFSEAGRVLKKNGYLCLRTTNSWSYLAFLARIIPNKYHSKVTRKVQTARREEDVFPTVYKCNSVGKVAAMLDKYDFEGVAYPYEAEPSYLSFAKMAYWFGTLYQRFIPRFFKMSLYVFAKRVD